jgi:hypothetical protein
MSGFIRQWFDWLELDEKWLPQLTESLKNIEIDGQLQNMDWDGQIEYLSPNWVEKAIKLALSSVKKGAKSEKYDIADNQSNTVFVALSPNEKSTKSGPSIGEKSTKLPNKKLQYLITSLLMSGSPISIDELLDIFEYRDKGKFRQNYLKPLESVGLITKTNPDKPTASNQKYVITEKG